jgi:hypothetical protein
LAAREDLEPPVEPHRLGLSLGQASPVLPDIDLDPLVVAGNAVLGDQSLMDHAGLQWTRSLSWLVAGCLLEILCEPLQVFLLEIAKQAGSAIGKRLAQRLRQAAAASAVRVDADAR